jgi:hypothetical protein
MHWRGGRTRLALAVVANDIRERESCTVSELLEWVVDSYVLSQALRFAIDKLRAGQFRFFVERNEEGYRIVKDDTIRQYFRRDADRLRGALSLLCDLGLLTAHEGGLVTPLGRKQWRKIAEQFD